MYTTRVRFQNDNCHQTCSCTRNKPVVFEETNSDCNASLILTPLFKELHEYENVQLLYAAQLHGQVTNSSTQQTVNSRQNEDL